MKISKVSVIVPVYNSEQFLKKCLLSIVNQTYQNIEILVINDGSTDNSLNIMKSLAKEYDNIKIFNQKNCGVAKTRNKAIEKASGKYVMFVDNDDFIDEDYVETFVKEIEKDNYDFVVGGFKRVDYNDNILYKRVYKNTPWSYYMFITPWARIYNREFLIKNEIEFLPVKVGEDINFSILAIANMNKANIIDYVGYNQLYNEQSVSNTVHKKSTSSNKQDLLDLYTNIYSKCSNEFLKKDIENLKYFFLKTTIWYLLYSSKNSNVDESLANYHEIIDLINKYYYNCYGKVSFFKPKGETFKTKVIVKTIVLLDKTKLLRPFIKIYSKL